jgi:hypothetical protein
VNVPIRTVLFTKLCKFDGEKTAILKVRDFQQISGRAGRKGFDDEGSVVAQAPEHVIENLRLEAKASNDPGKKRKIVKKKPPDWGYAHWDKSTFEKLVTALPEPLVSRFTLSHGMVVSVLSREEDGGCMALAHLIRDCHERHAQKRAIGRTALEMFKSLKEADILAFDHDDDGRRRTVVNTDLGEDFSIHHALSLYLLDTAKLLVTSDGAYELDLLTLVESILENPDIILARQLDKLKGDKVAEMKAAGVEYDERMAELEKMEYPKPNSEFIYGTFNAFAVKHPWVKADNIRPKSIAREMYENFMSFSEYVREYALERVEGVLLRYLSDVYKALMQTVPKWAKTDAVDDVATYFGAIVRQVDASLLDEWERMKNPAERIEARPDTDELEPAGSKDVTQDKRGFLVLVRNEIFRFVRAIARRDWIEAARSVVPLAEVGGVGAEVREAARIEEELKAYFAEHQAIRVDPEARSPRHLVIEQSEHTWRVRQTLLDPEDDNDWFVELTVDLDQSRETARPVLTLERFGR